MAILGRAQPPRPHLAKAVVGSGGPVPIPPVCQAGLCKTAFLRGFWTGDGRNRIIAAHVARGIVAPGGPVRLPYIAAVEVRQAAFLRSFWSADRRQQVGGLTAHLAPPIVPGPRGATVGVHQAAYLRSFWSADRRQQMGLAPHVAPPLVLPTQMPPNPPAVTVSEMSLRRGLVRRGVPQPHTAAPNLTPPPANSPLTSGTVLRRIGRRNGAVALPAMQGLPLLPDPPLPVNLRLGIVDSTLRRFGGRVYHAGPNLSPPQPPLVTAPIVIHGKQFAVRPPNPRRVVEPHTAAPNLTIGVSSPPVVTTPTMTTDQARLRARIGRQPSHPDYTGPNLTPLGAPAIVTARIVVHGNLFTVHPAGPRRTPAPHTATPNLTPPVPALVTVQQGPVGDQWLRRPLRGRSTPRPHYPPPNLHQIPTVCHLINFVVSADRHGVAGVKVTARLMPSDALLVSGDHGEVIDPVPTVFTATNGLWEMTLLQQFAIDRPSYWEITEAIPGQEDRIYAVTLSTTTVSLYQALITSNIPR